LSHAGDGAYTLEMEIPPGEMLWLDAGHLHKPSWAYELIADTPPAIRIEEEPKILDRGQIQIPLVLEDDYGVQELQMDVELAMSLPQPLPGEPFRETRSVM